MMSFPLVERLGQPVPSTDYISTTLNCSLINYPAVVPKLRGVTLVPHRSI